MKIYKHEWIPVSAPAEYWRTLGYTIYLNSDEIKSKDNLDQLVLIGMQKTKSKDEKALIWAINRRRNEVVENNRESRLSKAVIDLTNALNKVATVISQAYNVPEEY